MTNPEPPAGSVAPAGSIEPASSVFVIPGNPGKLGIFIVVLSGGQYVPGAAVTVTCSGPGVNVTVSGTTADRNSWAPTVDPSIPNGPSAFFWSVQSANAQEGGQYACHGSATFNGLKATF
jgi:hypothetical protein